MSQEVGPRRVRLALFFLITIGVLLGVIFLLGSSESLFSKRVILHTSFTNTSGLLPGAAVRLAGVDIGSVRAIHFDLDPAQKRIDVDLTVGAVFLDRIRTDSVAQLESKGLLGDMIVDVTIGNPSNPALKDGDRIESAESASLTKVVESVQTAIDKVNVLVTDVDSRLKEVLTPQVAADVGRIAHSTANVIEGIEHGKGLAHEVVYEPGLAREANRILERAEGLAEHLDASVNQIDQIVAQVRTGGGLLHGLIYEKEGPEALAELEKTAHQVSDVVTEIQTGHGMVHSVIYESDRTNLIENLSEAARIIRHLAEQTQEGKGTIGGLLVDPTAYQDLTLVLGNLKRNELLKALIRYTISNDGLKRSAEPTGAAPSSAP